MVRVALGLGVITCASAVSFRPPAIPLITTDPYFQSFIMGDNSTAGVVRHWDQRSKELVGMIRVNGKTYRFLGDCERDNTPHTPGPVEIHQDVDIAPGNCDIGGFGIGDDVQCNELCYGEPACQSFVIHGARCWLKSCAEPLVQKRGSKGYVLTGEHPPPPQSTCDFPAFEQVSVIVTPTRTMFQLRDPEAIVELNVTFLSTLFADDYPRLSRPVAYMVHDVRSLSEEAHKVELYLDATAQWVVNAANEEVEWNVVSGRLAARIGTAAQNVLGTKGDKTNINWGYMYLRAIAGQTVSIWAGSSNASRADFAATGSVPTYDDTRQPRQSDDDLPTLVLTASLPVVGREAIRHTALLGYDDVKSVRYYDEGDFAGYWTRTWDDIYAAMDAAAGELADMMAKSEKHDVDLLAKLEQVGGHEYSLIGALAYRQTLAATKLVWNSKRNELWNFLKEISTNGDMQTMDVVYPASPMLIYTRPELLAKLLIPVLAFANNETSTPFLSPFSPHEIGTYPIADHNTAQQEPMPMENTGNMFLMLAGIVKADPAHDTSFWYPKYWPLLSSWADYLNSTLPFPANQLCTDDFTGRLGNNTNLAAKGIVALEAFAGLCEAAGRDDCQKYRDSARSFAVTWKSEAWEEDHFKIAYDFPNSYSIKYNMVWQKLLGMDGPFNWDEIVPTEVRYYLSKANKYGPPMDSRHSYVKLDWLSWGAAMADDDASFHALQDPIYKMAHDSPTRVPLNDLYDTITAVAHSKSHFVDRPVVGGVFAKMLRAHIASAQQTATIFL